MAKAPPRKKRTATAAPKAPAKTTPTRRRTTTRSAAPADAITADVAAALRLRHLDDAPAVVATIATVGRGYRQGPASIPKFLSLAFDADQAVAEALVERFADGTRPAGIDRESHRHVARGTIDMTLLQLGIEADADARTTLTSLALGTWDPDADEKAKLSAIGGFLVAFFKAGLG